MEHGRFLCICHRGAMGHAPENTLASVRKAIEFGAPCMEVDVFSVDGRLVVFHDERLERTTNGSGRIQDQTFEYLRTLDAGGGERIPTLTEVLDTIDRAAGINIELKGSGTARAVIELIADYRNRGWDNDLFLVSSFDRRELEEARRLDPLLKIGVLIAGPTRGAVSYAGSIYGYSVHPSLRFVNRRFVDDAHSHGMCVFVFTVDDAEDIARMRELGVDGVFTNYPERALPREKSAGTAPGWL